MGIVKQWMMEKAEADQRRQMRQWFKDKHGRWPQPHETSKIVEEMVFDEVWEHAMGKDD
jgi:hypothetical protein